MGRRLVALAGQDPTFRLTAAIETRRPSAARPRRGRDRRRRSQRRHPPRPHDTDFDVLIDFSLPAAPCTGSTSASANAALNHRVTGLTDEQTAALARAARDVPVLRAPNMSTGVNLPACVWCGSGRPARRLRRRDRRGHHRSNATPPRARPPRLLNAVARAQHAGRQRDPRPARRRS